MDGPLTAWETFFFLVGSSAGALTGLQFVAIAIIAESRRRATTREIEAFATPTIVHFAAVLLVCGILTAPWRGLSRLSVALVCCAIGGLTYTLVVVSRARRQTTYRLVFEDWMWHVAMPLGAYALLLVSALFLRAEVGSVLFIIGGMTLLLLFVGIHNAWDAVTYITVDQANGSKKKRH